jgi:hypothetical protein
MTPRTKTGRETNFFDGSVYRSKRRREKDEIHNTRRRIRVARSKSKLGLQPFWVPAKEKALFLHPHSLATKELSEDGTWSTYPKASAG